MCSASADDAALSPSYKTFLEYIHRHESDALVDYSYEHAPHTSRNRHGYTLSTESFDTEVPIVLADTTVISIGPDIEHTTLDVDHQVTALWNHLNLTKLAVEIGVSHGFSDDLVLELGAEPGIYSDFSHEIHGNDLLGDAGLALYYKLNNSLTILAGAYTQQINDRNAYIPIGGLRFEMCDKSCFLSVTAPLNARFTYNFQNHLSLFIDYSGVGDRYYIQTKDATHFLIEESFSVVSTGVQIPLMKDLFLVPQIGYSISPSIDQVHTPHESLRLDSAVTASIALELSFRE